MILGFTGTQVGTTLRQRATLEVVLRMFSSAAEFHHGDCVGADAEAHDSVTRILPDCLIVIHPPASAKKRAYCNRGNVRLLSPQDYLIRNMEIVHACDHLIACPATTAEARRSGTWMTIRYARKLGKPMTLIFPTKGD